MMAAVLLIKAVQRWRAEHDSALPKTSKEKASFRTMLKSWQRHIDGVPLEVRCMQLSRLFSNSTR